VRWTAFKYRARKVRFELPKLAPLRHANFPENVGVDRKWPAHGQNDAIDPF
jgi:hypothetical protein